MGLKEYFAFAVASYNEGAEKPDRRLFNRALFLSRLPGIKAKDALHIGRQATADYHGAREAGWSSIIVSDWTPEKIIERYPSVQRNHIFPNLDELRKKWAQGAVKW
ncbi:rhythmically expressed gene 2 protein-like [Ctenocephalides felis]|nr:rhythmically expressed gene 2 protein-like [Ctenocephalides felis]